VDQTQREYNKKILDRIASDPTFREELLDDPKGAMERAGFKWEGSDEVSGYLFGSPLETPGGGGVSTIVDCKPVGGGGSTLMTNLCDPGGKKDPPPTPFTQSPVNE
jgi:hypothetical protein